MITGRNLICLLSSLSVASLVFFLHPKCLVEIQNPFMGGESRLKFLSIIDTLEGMFFKKQILVMETNTENMKVLGFNI